MTAGSGAAALTVPAVESIPAGVPFLDTLAADLIAAATAGAMALARTTVLLPTRRGCRAFTDALCRQAGERALLLPRIEPLGDVDADEFGLDEDLEGLEDPGLPPAMPPLRRQLLLARLVRAKEPGLSTEHAVRLAADLAGLLDRVAIEDLDLAALPALITGELADRPGGTELAAHWQTVVDFLAIVAEHWPQVLAGHAAIDAADRRNRLIRDRAAAWQRHPPGDPVIAAGSTGSIPATAELLAVIARLPRGRVILPGLDQAMSEAAWLAIGPTHPQYAMARLLDRLGLDRSGVRAWPVPAAAAGPSARAALINRALYPSRAAVPPLKGEASALDGLCRIDAPGPDEEARAIALILRESVETPGRTAALVTPDRSLARRVAAELRRWQIEIDDSAGVPLGRTPPGGLVRLLVRAVADALAPVSLLALLKHPLVGADGEQRTLRAAARRLERRLLRGLRPAAGTAGLRARLDDGAATGVFPADEAITLRAVIDDLDHRLAPLTGPAAAGAQDLSVWINGLLETLDRLADPGRLWDAEAGDALAAFITELADAGDGFEPLDAAAFASLLDVTLAGRSVRPRWGRHPRLFIWGPLEARLQQADVMVLGGLNEDVWPPAVEVGPWMSRGMMAAFGLPPPERRIGLSAHDFVQGVAAGRVVLTRADRVEGTPTVPSRWLARLDAAIGGDAAAALRDRGACWLAWQAALDQGPPTPMAERPAPAPPVAARPRTLSVTDIETWMRDPYALYARRILALRALDPLEQEPGPREFGTLAHRCLERFVTEAIDPLDNDAAARLRALAEPVLMALSGHPAVTAFWRPRLRRLADWVVEVERERRGRIAAVLAEVAGEQVVRNTDPPFVLKARADRIERHDDGSVTIIDYKTGSLPKQKDLDTGFAPQLPLEAAIARAGGFPGLAVPEVAGLEFWYLHHRHPEIRPVPGERPAKAAEDAVKGLSDLIAFYDDPATGYPARPRAAFAPAYSDYDHLTRLREWAAGEDNGGD